jgi:hypothetical protein
MNKNYNPQDNIPPEKINNTETFPHWKWVISAWLTFLAITIIFKIKVFIMIAPIIGFACFGYLVYVTYFLNKTDKNENNESENNEN